MKKVGIVLSGLGYDNGTSIWDVAYALREIERCSAKALPFVPSESIERSIPGPRRKTSPMRNFADEVAEMVRGEVYRMEEADARELDAILIPGGMGCVTVLSSLKRDGTEAQVLPELRELLAGIFARKKIIAAIGYGAVLAAFILRTRIHPVITLGDDAQLTETIKTVGADVVKVQPHEVVFDEENKIMSTPGTSPKSSLYRASLGIEVMICRMLKCKPERKYDK